VRPVCRADLCAILLEHALIRDALLRPLAGEGFRQFFGAQQMPPRIGGVSGNIS
jgi:hypothetical protein